MTESIGEIRKRAWKTRREKYGSIGHNGAYSRNPGPCPDCERMRSWLVRLHVEGALSEGQAAKATGLHRIDLRKAADEFAPPVSPYVAEYLGRRIEDEKPVFDAMRATEGK